MMMKGLWLGLVVGITFTCLLGQWVFSAASKETDSPTGISPEIVADYVHSVVQADRIFYQTEIVGRMREKGMVSSSESWKAGKRTEVSRYPFNFYRNRGGSWLNRERRFDSA